MVLSKLDEIGELGWLAVVFVAFWTAWPLGLAVLAFLAITGRMRGWGRLGGLWRSVRSDAPGAVLAGRVRRRPAASGNQAFDAYREETLRRLEEEQREFQDYLERLRRARDKAEFDGFMADRRRTPESAGPVGGDPA